MKLGILFSGGKDSCYALYKAKEEHEIVCLLSVISENQASYMFHTPNISLTDMQAEAMELSLLKKTTKGEKEIELEDLKALIKEAKEKFQVEGIVTGALASVYQASRIKKICDELDLESVNPLWMKDQIKFMRELIEEDFEVMITGVASEGLDDKWLGKIITKDNIDDLLNLSKKYLFNPAFEGGEAETTILDAPFFKKKIKVIKSNIEWDGTSGRFIIEDAELTDK